MTPAQSPICLKIPAWPASDRKLWERCFAAGGFFDDGGVFANWSDGSRRIRAQGYGTWLSFIQRRFPELMTTAPADRITQETVTAYIEEGAQRLKLRSMATLLVALVTVARGFAPGHDWNWLSHATRRIYQQSNPYQLKPPFPVDAADLYQWALRRLDQLSEDAHPDPVTHAMQFRQALNVGLLIACPVRSRAFVAMTVSRHVEMKDTGVMLRFYKEDMKDKKERRIPIPPDLAPYFDAYLHVHRAILQQGATSDALWFSQRGAPLCQDSFAGGLNILTERVFGVKLGPHAFRHIAATSIATYQPEHVGIIRDILGHATLRTSEQHYNRATMIDAGSKLQDALRTIRGRTKELERAKRRIGFSDRD